MNQLANKRREIASKIASHVLLKRERMCATKNTRVFFFDGLLVDECFVVVANEGYSLWSRKVGQTDNKIFFIKNEARTRLPDLL